MFQSIYVKLIYQFLQFSVYQFLRVIRSLGLGLRLGLGSLEMFSKKKETEIEKERVKVLQQAADRTKTTEK